MRINQLPYTILVAFHIGLGFIIYEIPFLAKVYTLFIFVFGVLLLLRSYNRNNEALLISSYLVGVEVFLRMTGGNPINELSKFLVIFFLVFGILFKGFSKNSYVYVFFLLLLIPGIIIGANDLGFATDVRKAIVFNISGPLCLGISSIYCYKRVVTKEDIYKILVFLGLPIISMTVYLLLYNPNVKNVVTGTQSNFETSGGFGPNQVSTILGLGMFIFFVLFLLFSKTKRMISLNFILTVILSYRGIVTFSRGGVITGVAMVVTFMVVVYFLSNQRAKLKVITIIVLCVLSVGLIWAYSIYSTNGLIENRYANEDALGREKSDRLGGREKLNKTEFEAFFENPILGIGVGRSKEYRKATINVDAASHNEITRMLADHGSLGVIGLLILIGTPLFLYSDNKQNIFLLSFFIFWLLTINHAAMRIAAPAFVYSLSLLKVYIKEPQLSNE